MSRPVLIVWLVSALACAAPPVDPPSDDAGGLADASGPNDSGATTDAGESFDASDVPDAGTPPDAGGSTDAGETFDAGEPPDAGPFVQPPLWETSLINDATTADCHFTNQRAAFKDNVALTVWDVDYLSYESIGGTLHPIRIKGFLARPAGTTGRVPAVVEAHGLGGHTKQDSATGLAARLGMIVLTYTGPGGGDAPENTSEGRPSGYDEGRRMFDTLPDLRGNWFWGHAMAAMRGVTCLTTRDDVDPSRLGMTGYSAGAVATLIVGAADPRVTVTVPLSGTHAWSEAVRSPDAWQHALLTKAGYTTSSEQWVRLQEHLIAPAATAASTHAKVLMVNGSTDEFFPLNAHLATFDAIPGTQKRTSFAANFDHGCYLVSGVESAATIEARADLRATGGQRAWFKHHFGTDADYATLPFQPTATLAPFGAVQAVVATVDESVGPLQVEDVRFWWSNDGFVWGDVQLDRQSANTWGEVVAVPAGVAWFVDVQYKTRDFVFPERFSFSTRPELPAGWVPRIRGMTTCL